MKQACITFELVLGYQLPYFAQCMVLTYNAHAFSILVFISTMFQPLLLHPSSLLSNCYCPLLALLLYSLQILRYTLPVPHNWNAFAFHFLSLPRQYTFIHKSYKFRLRIQVSAFIPFATSCLHLLYNYFQSITGY